MNKTKTTIYRLINNLNYFSTQINKKMTNYTTTTTSTTIQTPITVGNQNTIITTTSTNPYVLGSTGISGLIGLTATTGFMYSGYTDGYYHYKVKIKSGDQEYEISKTIQIDDCDVHMFFAVEKQKNFVKWDIPKEQKTKMDKLKFNAKLKKISKIDAEEKESGGDNPN